MHLLRWGRNCALGAALFGLILAPGARASAADETAITGTVRSGSGAAVPGATVVARGPSLARTVTDAAGGFSVSVTPGTYTITVTKTGYGPTSIADVVVTAGQVTPLGVTLTEENLTSLRTIGTVSTTGRGSSTINTGAANQSIVSGAVFQQLADPQINDVLQRIPDVVIQKLGTQQDTAIVIGGLQPYETQVLIDGHPLALGQYGVWLTQYFPSYMIGNVETQSGPGNTTPFANIAVGGTANLQTIGFTKKQTAEFNIGVDNYGSQYSNALVTGSVDKFDYVVSLGDAGDNGYYFGKRECDTYQAPTIVAFCGDFSGSLFSRAQLYKVKYDFSPVTSFDATFLGSYGGYSPQGSAWGEDYGPETIQQCVPGTYICTNPRDANLIGKTINGFYWFPGTFIWNTQQLYSGQLRTAIGSTTLLARPYIGSLQPETYDGQGEGNYPAFFGPPPNYTGMPPTGLPAYPGPPSLPPGVKIPATGLTNPNPFESTACPVGNVLSFVQINSPKNTINSVDGQEECYQYPYSTYEIDKLYGSTFSAIQPIMSGSGYLDLTYDFHGQSTFAYANAPTNVQVPHSSTRFSTFSLTGTVTPLQKLGVNFGLYNTNWTIAGQQPLLNSSGTVIGTQGLDRTVSRFDPHVALTFRADPNTSLRAAFGTSESFPFIGDVSGTASTQPPAFQYTAGITTEKNPNLQPEFSQGYDLGVDHRFRYGSVLSFDLQDTTVHNVFQQITTQENVIYNGQPAILGIFTPINVARLAAKLATLKYSYSPLRGFGYNLALTADSSIISGIPASGYNSSPALPANNVQVCGGGSFTPGLATCVPYLKGYGQVNYELNKGTFVSLGVDYEGKNNAYYQPPFAIVDFGFKQPLTENLEFNMSVQNLLNTNSYNYLAQPGLGVPAVADYTNNGTTIQQGSYPTYRLPAATRTLRFSVRAHIGR